MRRRFRAFLLAICLPAPAVAEQWPELASRQGIRFYIDQDSVQFLASQDVVQYWEKDLLIRGCNTSTPFFKQVGLGGYTLSLSQLSRDRRIRTIDLRVCKPSGVCIHRTSKHNRWTTLFRVPGRTSAGRPFPNSLNEELYSNRLAKSPTTAVML